MSEFLFKLSSKHRTISCSSGHDFDTGANGKQTNVFQTLTLGKQVGNCKLVRPRVVNEEDSVSGDIVTGIGKEKNYFRGEVKSVTQIISCT